MSNKEFHYVIHKILNNNVVISTDENGREVIITGNGIGFHAHVGFRVNEREIFQIYELQGNENRKRFELLLNEIPFECVQLTQQIIDSASKKLHRTFNPNLIVALSDHINFAVTQTKMGTAHPHLMSEEIRRFYKAEYAAGTHAVDMINHKYEIQLPASEAASIAFHLIDAESDAGVDDTTEIINSTDEILKIIQGLLHIEFQEESLSYSRLITHIQYFLKRVIAKEASAQSDFNAVFFNEEDENYQKIAVCLDQIQTYLQKKFDYTMGAEERVYLLIHITRVLQTNEEREK
jgi:beta-glucoside operon transcriptional antiterminator